MNEDLIQKAKDDAFNLLSYRERSQNELKKRLLKKGYNHELVEIVISKFKELDYINDQRFARKWIKYRIEYKPRGRYLLKLELRQKGIEEDIIDQLLDDLVDEQVELELAIKLANKWLKARIKQEGKVIKLKRYLQNKGFSLQIINEIIARLKIK